MNIKIPEYWYAFSVMLGLLALMPAVQAQTGLLHADERYQKLPVLPAYTGVKFNDIPIRVNLRKYCPVPGDQRSIGACVGWAVGYNALTLLRAVRNNITDKALITQKANSAAFIYNQVKLGVADCNKGAFIEDALILLKEKGDCLEERFNYQKNSCDRLPDGQALAEASLYKILDYAAVFAVQAEGKQKISGICKVLATQTPVIVGIGVTKTFSEILPGQRLWDPAPDEAIEQYHAMVVVGYDNVDKRFLLMNSFGTTWGNEGFISVPFDDFERLCRYAYMMLLEPAQSASFIPPSVPSSYSVAGGSDPFNGAFVFRRPGGYAENANGDEIMLFEEADAVLQNQSGFYVTKQTTFSVGDVFQLLAREIPRGRYAYIFSQNPNGEVKLHFPQYAETGETAGFFIEEHAEIILPSEETALQLSEPGYDYLCIVYSYSELPDIHTRIAKFGREQGEIMDKMQAVFGDCLIPSSQIRYESTRMAFQAMAAPGKGKIAVPIVLRVKAE